MAGSRSTGVRLRGQKLRSPKMEINAGIRRARTTKASRSTPTHIANANSWNCRKSIKASAANEMRLTRHVAKVVVKTARSGIRPIDDLVDGFEPFGFNG